MSPEFRRRLRREVRLYIQEMRDGCIECAGRIALCHECNKVALDILVNPRKYVTVTPKRKGDK